MVINLVLKKTQQFIHAMRIKAIIRKIPFTGTRYLDDVNSNFIPASNKQLYLQVRFVLY